MGLKTQEALKLALRALVAIGHEYICQATHHKKKDQHGRFDDCPNAERHQKAITAIREALAEQPAPEPTTKQKVDAAVEQYAKTGNGRVLEAALRNIIINETLDKMAKNARELGLDYEPAQKDYKAFYDGKKWYSVGVEQPAQQHDYWQEEARRYAQNADFWRGKYESATAQQQEPVAWLHTKIEGVAVPHRPADLDKHPDRWEALYKTPPPCPTCEALARTVMLDQTYHDAQRKPWVGLTDEETKAIHRNAGVTYLVPADYDRHLFTHLTDVQLMKISKAIEAKLREKNA